MLLREYQLKLKDLEDMINYFEGKNKELYELLKELQPSEEYRQFIRNLLIFDVQYVALFNKVRGELPEEVMLDIILCFLPDKDISGSMLDSFRELLEVTQQHISRYNNYMMLHPKK